MKDQIVAWYFGHTTEATLAVGVAQTVLSLADKNMPWWMFMAAVLVVEGSKLLKIKADAAKAAANGNP
jgi:hypothetical protein